MFEKILDRVRMTPEQFCEKYGHDVEQWTETSGLGKFGDCKRCGAKNVKLPYSS